MNDSMFLIVAIIVFALLAIGLALTVFEFRNGEPHQQELEAEREDNRLARPRVSEQHHGRQPEKSEETDDVGHRGDERP